ncbi:unnamed protein product [Prorocentrum cordatum]|uniref:Uncharacterized protein n=1 Tax=Prorocentrum cordatum TaxID=2364126 RepID=A0ABN9Q5M7_9DINO|nr:unnamed protein product [Polarella glacialis]
MGLALSDMLRSRRGNAAAALAAIFVLSAAWGSCPTRSSKSMIMSIGLRIGSSVGRSSSQRCWKASNLCENMKDYIDRNGLTHIFVGTSSKTGGSTTKIENLSRLARHVYRRDDPIESANNAESDHLFRPVIYISDHAMLAGYNAPYWVQPYATAAKASDCAVASALGLQVVKR